jgi:hypothetical protein
MKNPLLFTLLFALAAAGCQGNPQVRRVVDSVQAEARQLEDLIYLQQQDIQVLEQQNAKLKRQIERGGGSGSSGTRRSPGREENPELQPPGVEMPDEKQEPPARPPNRIPAEPDTGPVLEPPKKKPGAGNVKPTVHEQAEGTEPEVTDKKVTHIFVNPLHTCGMDFDHAPGDDGVSILIEPRNSGNQFVPVAAPVSVVVLDSSKSGDDARIARWDFTQAEAAEKIVSGDKRGIHLKLPWPTRPPAGAKLDIYVRYETPDGKKLQGEKEVVVALPGQYSQRWTPRPADRQRKRTEGPRVAAVPTIPESAAAPLPVAEPAVAAEPLAEAPPTAKEPPRLVPPTGLSERQPGEKPARPKWSPTR